MRRPTPASIKAARGFSSFSQGFHSTISVAQAFHSSNLVAQAFQPVPDAARDGPLSAVTYHLDVARSPRGPRRPAYSGHGGAVPLRTAHVARNAHNPHRVSIPPSRWHRLSIPPSRWHRVSIPPSWWHRLSIPPSRWHRLSIPPTWWHRLSSLCPTRPETPRDQTCLSLKPRGVKPGTAQSRYQPGRGLRVINSLAFSLLVKRCLVAS